MKRPGLISIEHTLQLKQAFITATDAANLDQSQCQTLKDLIEPIAGLAEDFERERKEVLKSSKNPNMNKKIQEMQFRVDQEGVLIYNRVEEMSASRAGDSIEDIDIVLAQGKECKEIGLTE
jgi:hypothetical protein